MSETRKLAAILVADVVGYSRLAGAYEDRTLARLRGLRSDLIDPAIAAHHGRIVKRTGDGGVVEFRSVLNAVRCAIEIQAGLAERNVGVPSDRRIEFRIGVHVGDVVEEADGDLMGDSVNIAARLEGICEPGGICLSEDAYRQVKSRLDLQGADLGPQTLKNIVEPVHAFLLRKGAHPPTKPAGAATNSRPSIYAMAVFAALAVLLITGAGYALRGSMTPRQPVASVSEDKLRTAPILSIVVLPFQSPGGDLEEESFAAAITDDLATDLSRLADSHVISRSTADTYRDKRIDAQSIGRELGVRYLIEVSTRRSGDTVQVNAQLISTESGMHLWADRFDGDRSNPKLQFETVARIARSVDHALVREESLRSMRERPNDPDAVDLRLRGEAILWAPDVNVSTLREAVGLLDRAHALNPRDARTVTMLATALAWRTDLSAATPLSIMGTAASQDAADLRRAETLLDSALAANPSDTWSHWTKGYIFSMRGQWSSALREAEQAIAVDPGNAMAYASAGYWKMHLGRSADGVADVETALRLNPRDPKAPSWQNYLCFLHTHLAQWEQAIKECNKAVAANPGYPGPLSNLAAAYAWVGRDKEANEAARQLRGLTPNYLGFLQTYSDAHDDQMFKAETARIIEGLRKAGVTDRDAESD